MKVRSEAVQIRVLAEEIGVRPRRRSLPYVEQPGADFFSQSAEMCRRSRTFMNNAGYTPSPLRVRLVRERAVYVTRHVAAIDEELRPRTI